MLQAPVLVTFFFPGRMVFGRGPALPKTSVCGAILRRRGGVIGVRIKICGFTRAEDIDIACTLGVDAVGIVLAADALHPLSAATVRTLLQETRGRAETVAVLGPASMRQIDEALRMGFDIAQVVVGKEPSPAEFERRDVIPVFFDGVDVGERMRSALRSHAVASLLSENVHRSSLRGLVSLDGPLGGGRGIPADWRRAADLAQEFELMLAGGLTPENVANALHVTAPAAVDVSSGVESTPGAKDAERMRAFVQAVRFFSKGSIGNDDGT
jgi:phosphoribosylanthranilate isomerase